MSIPLLSPGLASDELISKALPDKIVMITCWGDGLLIEAEIFRERLKKLGKTVEGYTVPGVPHGWDKWPSVSYSLISSELLRLALRKQELCDLFK